MKNRISETSKVVSFIKGKVESPAFITRLTFTIRCSCKKRIEFEGSYLGDPEVYEWLEGHAKHGCSFRLGKNGEFGEWIEIPKPERVESGGDTQVEQTEENAQTQQVHGGESEPEIESLNERVLERVESDEGKHEAHTKIDTELDGVKGKFDKWLKLEDRHIIDVVLGAIIANYLQGDPVNILVVGPPSSAKTEILRTTFSSPKVYPLSSLTPQTFISGLKEKGAKNSLLSTLKERGKVILAIKDFTTVLEMRNESRQEILSQLREIADGDYRKAFGTGKEVTWTGKLGIIAGVTPVIDQHHSVRQILGERFLYYRISQNDKKAAAEMALKFAGREKEMREELEEATKVFLEKIDKAKTEDIFIGNEIQNKLINLSTFIAIARTGVSRDHYTQVINFLPESEGPPRLMKQLSTLGRGIALVHGKGEIDEEVYSILKKVGRDSLPSYRNLILREMWKGKIKEDHWERLKVLGEFFKSPTATIRIYLEDLAILGLSEKRLGGKYLGDSENAPYFWRISEKCCDLIQCSEVYNEGERGAS